MIQKWEIPTRRKCFLKIGRELTQLRDGRACLEISKHREISVSLFSKNLIPRSRFEIQGDTIWADSYTKRSFLVKHLHESSFFDIFTSSFFFVWQISKSSFKGMVHVSGEARLINNIRLRTSSGAVKIIFVARNKVWDHDSRCVG